MQRTAPDLTVYEDEEHIHLKKWLDSQSAKRKMKLCISSQQNACSQFETHDDYNEQGFVNSAPNDYAALDPKEVSQYLEEVENIHKIISEEAEFNKADETLATEYVETEPNLPITTDSAAIEPKKHSSMPANKQLKRTKTMNPQDVTEKKTSTSRLISCECHKVNSCRNYGCCSNDRKLYAGVETRYKTASKRQLLGDSDVIQCCNAACKFN